MDIIAELFKLQDLEYKEFQSRVIPNIDKDLIIGVRVPEIKKLSKLVDIASLTLPHKYYDEYMLHSACFNNIKDYDLCINELDRYLKYVDNWAVSDTISPKVFKKNHDKLIIKVKEWCKSKYTYECRFGIKTLMAEYLDKDFKKEYLNIPLNIKSDEYYIKMMIAWFYATALIKQYESTIIILESKKLDKWIHNKTISKAIDSFRITKEQKEYLKTLRIY